MCIKGALPADIPRPWPALVSAPCTELFSTAEIQPCCFLLQLPPSSKARSWSPEAREGSSGLCAQEMLKCSLISVGSPLSESVSCGGSGPVLSLVLLQPQHLGCAGGSPAEEWNLVIPLWSQPLRREFVTPFGELW